MSLVIHREYLSLNYDSEEIPVAFLVLHYTAASLFGTLRIFQNPRSRASCHLIVDMDGSVYELVPCLDGKCLKAWHAGESYWPVSTVDVHHLQGSDNNVKKSAAKMSSATRGAQKSAWTLIGKHGVQGSDIGAGNRGGGESPQTFTGKHGVQSSDMGAGNRGGGESPRTLIGKHGVQGSDMGAGNRGGGESPQTLTGKHGVQGSDMGAGNRGGGESPQTLTGKHGVQSSDMGAGNRGGGESPQTLTGKHGVQGSDMGAGNRGEATPPLGGFNGFSIGIELVNRNGNLFPYTKAQYRSLALICKRLQRYYKALCNPERVLGHEHIAGYRGKVDPGHCFDWSLFFKMSYGSSGILNREPILSSEACSRFSELSSRFLSLGGCRDKDWVLLNRQMEQAAQLEQASIAHSHR